MHRGHWVFVFFSLALAALLVADDARAAGRVELVLTADRYAPLTAQQTWARELGTAGVQNVRLRQQRSNDRVGIEVRGTKNSPIYVVTGVLDSRGEIVLPGGRYHHGQASRIAAWVKDLARRGPPDSREPSVAFGLPRSQMMAVRDDLAGPIDFSTRGIPRAEVVRKIAHRLKLPVRVDERLLATGQHDRVAEELRGLSCGTGLACVLRPLRLVLVPRMSSTGPEYLITTARGQRETWPVGWTPEKRRGEVLPKLFERLALHVDNQPAADVLEQMAKRLEVPALVDHAAVARHGVDRNKLVKVSQRRRTYNELLDRALFQAGMQYELRTDEAGRPFLWVTTLKP